MSPIEEAPDPGPKSDRAVVFNALQELREITVALSLEAVVLQAELEASQGGPSLNAVNKLQAVLGEIEIAGLLTGRIVRGIRKYLNVPRKEAACGDERLSVREREVLRLLTQGRTISEIARTVGLSIRTISTYRSRALRKMGLRTTAQLVRYGISHHLDS